MFGITKDPNGVAIYTIDWDTWLTSVNGGTISTSTWLVPTGLTSIAETNTATTTTIKLSGGTAGVTYTLVNRITTSAGLIEDRSIVILGKDL